jgi:hypothetical protein
MLSFTCSWLQLLQPAAPGETHIQVQAYVFLRGVLFGGFFRHNFAENCPQGLKILRKRRKKKKRRAAQFYTICDKNQLLNKNIEKVMAILVLRSWDVSCQVGRAENPVHMPRFGW